MHKLSSAYLLHAMQVNGWHQHGWHQAPQPRPPPHWQQTPRGRGRGRGRGRLTDSHPGNISQHSNGQAAAPSAVQMQAAAAAEAAEREAAAQAAAEAKLQQSEAQIADLKQRIAQQQAEKAARQVGGRGHCAALSHCFWLRAITCAAAVSWHQQSRRLRRRRGRWVAEATVVL